MTEKQFWMKLDQIAQKRDKEGVFIEARKVLKHRRMKMIFALFARWFVIAKTQPSVGSYILV